jgi:hypothetical protein
MAVELLASAILGAASVGSLALRVQMSPGEIFFDVLETRLAWSTRHAIARFRRQNADRAGDSRDGVARGSVSGYTGPPA